MVEKKLTEIEVKLGGTKLKLAEEKSLNLAKLMRLLTLKRPLMLARKSGTMKASRMLKTLWSPLSIKPSIMGSGRGSW